MKMPRGMTLTVALFASALGAAAQPAGAPSPCENLAQGSKTVPAACIQHRVGILLDVKAVFLTIVREGVPPGLAQSESQSAKRWLAWLESSAGKIGTLADFGARSVGGVRHSAAGGSTIGSAVGGSSQEQLLAATKQMQETQMSFNLQYLQLQSQMQNENRSFTAVSTIMKTKHDTVKNSIINIR